MIQFIVLYSFFLQDYISFIFWLVFFFVVFSFGVVVFHILYFYSFSWPFSSLSCRLKPCHEFSRIFYGYHLFLVCESLLVIISFIWSVQQLFSFIILAYSFSCMPIHNSYFWCTNVITLVNPLPRH